MPPHQAISFARGVPSPDIIDAEGLAEAAKVAFSEHVTQAWGYGPPTGFEPLRQQIADRHGVTADNVLVTNGSMQAVSFLFDLIVEAGSHVVVESPTYDCTLKNLGGRGAVLHSVPMTDDGIDVDQLAEALAGGLRPDLVHVIPNFQNPSGHTMAPRHRKHLVELAAEWDFVILEDDPYHDLNFEGESPQTLLSLDTRDRVVLASSFSKTIAPGLRCGYLVAPERLIRDLTAIASNSYLCPNMTTQVIAYEFGASGRLDNALHHARTALRLRRDTMITELRREIPEARFTTPSGGYFLWVDMPAEIPVSQLAFEAGKLGVGFTAGEEFFLHREGNFLRLAYSGLQPSQIRDGIQRLTAAARALPIG
jgi:DNA-binding transcriptional MocR family regulator